MLANIDTIYTQPLFIYFKTQFWRVTNLLVFLTFMSSCNLQQAALISLIIYCFDAESN